MILICILKSEWYVLIPQNVLNLFLRDRSRLPKLAVQEDKWPLYQLKTQWLKGLGQKKSGNAEEWCVCVCVCMCVCVCVYVCLCVGVCVSV
jgi:hypothetical protein